MASVKSILIASIATIAAASPIANAPRDDPAITKSSILTTIAPTTLSQWYSASNSVIYDTHQGLAQRYRGSPMDVSTLLTFDIPSQYKANTCELVFTLNDPNSSYATGSRAAQIFFDNKPARAGATSNNRDNQIATLRAVSGGAATFGGVDSSGSSPSYRIACSALIARPYLELAPQGEEVGIYYRERDGLKVNVLA